MIIGDDELMMIGSKKSGVFSKILRIILIKCFLFILFSCFIRMNLLFYKKGLKRKRDSFILYFFFFFQFCFTICLHIITSFLQYLNHTLFLFCSDRISLIGVNADSLSVYLIYKVLHLSSLICSSLIFFLSFRQKVVKLSQ